MGPHPRVLGCTRLASEEYQVDDELASGKYIGVFIDDTGSPGLTETPPYLHPDRSTWVAVVIQPDRLPDLMAKYSSLFLSGLNLFYGATEFHSTDVFSANGPFKGVDLKTRLDLLSVMAGIVKRYDAQILTENLDPDAVDAIRAKVSSLPSKLGPFDLRTPKGMALVSLLNRVSEYVVKTRQTVDTRAYVIVDAGILRHGMAITSPWPSVFARDKVYFADSRSICLLQLADFAAFGLNRVHLSLGRTEIKPADAALLEMLSTISSNYRDLVRLDAELHAAGDGSYRARNFRHHADH